MRITYGDVLLASDNIALDRFGPAGLAVNGQQIVEQVPLYALATAGIFPRGGGSEAVSFSVHRFFDTEADAARFLLLHRAELAASADLILEQGDQVIALEGAAFVNVTREQWRGTALLIRYSFVGGAWSTDIPPAPDPDESMIRRGLVDVDSGATTVAVVFDSALPTTPVVQGTVLQMPTAGGDVIFAAPIQDTITTAGVTYALSGPPSASGYKLPYFAST
jgi:hypothetical protein